MGKIADAIRGLALPEQKHRQMLALDQEFSALEAKVKTLESERLHLQAEVNPLKRDIDRLKETIQHHTAPAPTIDETKEQILRLLNEGPRARSYGVGQVLEMSEEAAKFHLESLRKDGLIEFGFDQNGDLWWLTQDGRAYLHKKGWLK